VYCLYAFLHFQKDSIKDNWDDDDDDKDSEEPMDEQEDGMCWVDCVCLTKLLIDLISVLYDLTVVFAFKK